MPSDLSHLNAAGEAVMVDVSPKAETQRGARAISRVTMSAAATRCLEKHDGPKGDPVQVARIAAIMAAKKTSDLLPMCHPLRISSVEVMANPTDTGMEFDVTVRAVDRTGVEMEALTAASVAALALVDMLKAVDPAMCIVDVRLLEKWGGKRGHYSVER